MKDIFDNKFTDQVSLTYDHLVPEISSYLKINEIEEKFKEGIDILVVERSNSTPNKNFNLQWFYSLSQIIFY